MTQEQIAESVGKDRSSVANYVRLLRLPTEIRDHVGAGTLSMGHARALLGLPDDAAQLRIGRDVVAKALSVRETETLVKRTVAPPPDKPDEQKDVHTRAAEEKLRFALGTRVRIIRKGKGGRVEIDFGDENELHRIYEQLDGEELDQLPTSKLPIPRRNRTRNRRGTSQEAACSELLAEFRASSRWTLGVGGLERWDWKWN